MLSYACSTVAVKTEVIKGTLPARLEATKFEEVELITAEGDIHKGKIVSLEGEGLEFRPFPYWNIELIKLNLDEIHSIKLAKKGSRAAKRFASGFGWAFMIAGTIGGATSKYDEDYQIALLGSAIVGGAGGLLGLVISTKTKFEFYRMSREEKERAIRKIMGLPVR